MSRRNYRPIPGVTDGRTHLTIYEPGEFMPEDTSYLVGVGGSGVARAQDLDAAKAILLDRAKMYCQTQIAEAQRTMTHYQAELLRLNTAGLEGEVIQAVQR